MVTKPTISINVQIELPLHEMPDNEVRTKLDLVRTFMAELKKLDPQSSVHPVVTTRESKT